MKIDIEAMAREAGGGYVGEDDPQCWSGNHAFDDDALEAFARLIVERCASVCDKRYMGDNNREDMEARKCAAAIRRLVDD